MEKAPEAFRTISEVAEDLALPQHVLRFWETRFNQIKPMKRAGGRRYYRPAEVDLIKGIKTLLYGSGYTIRGVQRILREKGVAHVAAVGRGEAEDTPQGKEPRRAENRVPSAEKAAHMAAASSVVQGSTPAGQKIPCSPKDMPPRRVTSNANPQEANLANVQELRAIIEELSSVRRRLLSER